MPVTRSHFISYSPADSHDFVVELRDELERGTPPITIWHDKRDLRPGEEWDSQIDRAIRACETLIFVMTKDSVADDSVCKPEWSRALRYRKPVVPLLLQPDAEMPFRLDNRQYIDFARFDEGVVKLREHLEWLRSPEGVAHALRQSLGDMRRSLVRSQNDQERARLAAEIQQLERQVERSEELSRSQDDEEAVAAASARLGQQVEALMPPSESRPTAGRRARRWRRSSPRIFLCYRRDDTAAYAGRLQDVLSDRFGSDRIIMEVSSIQPGVDFAEAISTAVAGSEAMLVLIGRRWLSPRIDDPRDYVRVEIEAALQRDLLVIPVLLEGATMPTESELPPGLRDLARRQAIELDDARWSYGVERLIAALEQLVGT